jgi:hypothetical protein
MVGANVGPSEDQINPGMILAVTGVGIQRVQPEQTVPTALVVDAAEVNPPPKTERSSRRKRVGGAAGGD